MTGLLLDTSLNDEQRDFVKTIRDSGDALLTIINDILDFSKIEAGAMELDIQPFDLRECVESALDLMTAKAREKSLDFAYLIDAGLPNHFRSDVTRIRQVLVNLMGNAIKFTKVGEVVISVKGEIIPQTEEGDPNVARYELHFSVRDTGIGIPQERMDRLFKPFSQVDASTTRKFGGTGLGLVISKRLVELMGGRIWVESEIGQGSTFHFTLQAEASPGLAPVYLLEDQPELSNKRILIVDDNATNRKIMALQAKSWGMQFWLASSGAQALDYIRNDIPFDLAILDMQMPEMDGLMLAERIRRHRDAKALPLVMLTSLGHRVNDPREELFVAYLTKPIKTAQLYRALFQVLRNMVMKRLGHALDETINVWGRFTFLLPFTGAAGSSAITLPPSPSME